MRLYHQMAAQHQSSIKVVVPDFITWRSQLFWKVKHLLNNKVYYTFCVCIKLSHIFLTDMIMSQLYLNVYIFYIIQHMHIGSILA